MTEGLKLGQTRSFTSTTSPGEHVASFDPVCVPPSSRSTSSLFDTGWITGLLATWVAMHCLLYIAATSPHVMSTGPGTTGWFATSSEMEDNLSRTMPLVTVVESSTLKAFPRY